MLEILQFIFSGFWTWLGVTILVYLISKLLYSWAKFVYSICAHDNILRREALLKIIENDILSNQGITPHKKILQIYAIINFSHNLRYIDKNSLIEEAKSIEKLKM